MSDGVRQPQAASLTRYARALRFAVVGVAATLAYALLATLFHAVLPFPAALSSGLAYLVCSLGSYIGHRFFTFSAVQERPRGGQMFFLLSLVGHGLSFVIPAMISDFLGFATWVSTLATCTVIPLCSALLTSRLVFGVPLLPAKS